MYEKDRFIGNPYAIAAASLRSGIDDEAPGVRNACVLAGRRGCGIVIGSTTCECERGIAPSRPAPAAAAPATNAIVRSPWDDDDVWLDGVPGGSGDVEYTLPGVAHPSASAAAASSSAAWRRVRTREICARCVALRAYSSTCSRREGSAGWRRASERVFLFGRKA